MSSSRAKVLKADSTPLHHRESNPQPSGLNNSVTTCPTESKRGKIKLRELETGLYETPSPDAKPKSGRGQQASRGHRPRSPSRQNESRSALNSRAPFGYPDRFSVIFLSCKTNARVFDAKSGHGPHSPPPGAAATPKHLTSHNLQYTTDPVWARNPGNQSTKAYPSQT